MAEGRILKRKVSTDWRVAQLTSHSALLYTLAIPHLDRDGRLSGHPIIVRGTVVPAFAHRRRDEWSDELVERYMDEWLRTTDEQGGLRPLVLRYCVRGTWACWFPGFKNQSIRYDREAPSSLPAPPPHLVDQYGLQDAAPEPPTPESEDAALRVSLHNRAHALEHRAREAGVEWERVDLYAIAERYAWTCYLCHQRITVLTGQRSECLSFDHIVPHSAGGTHTIENIAPAHFGCNAGKCDRLLSESQLTLQPTGAAPVLAGPVPLTPGAEAEAEVQVEPPEQRRAFARAREEDALTALQDSEGQRDRLVDEIVAGVARRKTALVSHGPLARLLEVLHDADDNTPKVMHALFDSLGENAIEFARREIVDHQPRRPSAYAQGIARRLAGKQVAA